MRHLDGKNAEKLELLPRNGAADFLTEESAMLMPERLETHLNVKHIPYSLIFHPPTTSAQMSAALMHLPGKEVA